MKKSDLLTVSAIILGICGAFLRAKHLLTGFETDTGLPLRSINPYGLALVVLTACVFLFFLILALLYRRTAGIGASSSLYHISGVNQVSVRVLSAFLMFLASIIGIYQFLLHNSVSILIISLLSLVSGAGLISLTLAQKKDCLSDEHLICAAAPVFWICFLLIYYYREHSANPVFGSFSYELFALAVSMMAIFYFSGFFFARPYPARALFTSSFAIYMILTAYGGRVLCSVLGNRFYELPASLLWLCGMSSILLLVIANSSLLNRALYGKR